MAPPAPEQRQRGGLKYEVDITAPLAPKVGIFDDKIYKANRSYLITQ